MACLLFSLNAISKQHMTLTVFQHTLATVGNLPEIAKTVPAPKLTHAWRKAVTQGTLSSKNWFKQPNRI